MWFQKLALIQPRLDLSKIADTSIPHPPPVISSALPTRLLHHHLALLVDFYSSAARHCQCVSRRAALSLCLCVILYQSRQLI